MPPHFDPYGLHAVAQQALRLGRTQPRQQARQATQGTGDAPRAGLVERLQLRAERFQLLQMQAAQLLQLAQLLLLRLNLM